MILATLSACRTKVDVDPRSLETAVLEGTAFPDGRTIEVSPQGQFLVSRDGHDQGAFQIDNPGFWDFRMPDGSILFTRVYLFARITRHGDRLTMQLIKDDGILATCELPIEDTRYAGRLVTRHEHHAVDQGDHPPIDETTKDDFFLSPEGDLIVRRLNSFRFEVRQK